MKQNLLIVIAVIFTALAANAQKGKPTSLIDVVPDEETGIVGNITKQYPFILTEEEPGKDGAYIGGSSIEGTDAKFVLLNDSLILKVGHMKAYKTSPYIKIQLIKRKETADNYVKDPAKVGYIMVTFTDLAKYADLDDMLIVIPDEEE